VTEIEISNLQSHVPIAVAWVRRVVRAVFAAEHVAGATVSIALVDNATIRRINRDYLHHDYDTDVLSFLFESLCVARRHARPIANPRRADGRHLDGEVVVSGEMAVATAGRFGWSPREELTLYLVHGLLHLCGYDDQTPRERRIMRERERVILAELGIVSRPNRSRRRSVRRVPAKNGTVP
jgi:probable rRNA maturation factor